MIRRVLVLLPVLGILSACSDMPDMDTARLADRRQDYTTAVSHYQRLADFGLPAARMELGKHYLAGKGVNQDPEKALRLFEQAGASDAVSDAKMQLALMALQGKSRTLSPARGAAIMEELARDGNVRAMFELGLAHEKGIGVGKNIPLALDYYAKAGGAGYGRADYNRAFIYEKGKLAPQNLPLALSLYKSAAEKGYEKSYQSLARFYKDGLAGGKNEKLAELYLKKAEEFTNESTDSKRN